MKVSPRVRASAVVMGLVAAGVAAPARSQTCGGTWVDGFGSPALPAGVGGVVFDSGTGPTLHVAAGVRVYRLDGGRWVSLGTNFLANLTGPVTGGGGTLRAIAVFDDGSGPKLYAAGTFARAPGGVVTRDIARWNGTAWEGFGPGTTSGSSPTRGITNYQLPSSPGVHMVLTLCVHDDDGPGPIAPALYAGGRFSGAGNILAANVVRWDGSAWTALQNGVDETVYAMQSADLDGDGAQPPVLLVGGVFNAARNFSGGVTDTAGTAKWNGTEWSSLGASLPLGTLPVRVIDAVDGDGAGPNPPRVVIGTQASPYLSAIELGGTTWEAFEGGVTNVPLALLVRRSAGGDQMIVGGGFTTVGASAVSAPSAASWSAAGGWTAIGDGLYTDCGPTVTSSSPPVALLDLDPDAAGPLPTSLHAFGSWQTTPQFGLQGAARLDASGNVWQPVTSVQGGTSQFATLTVLDIDGPGGDGPQLLASYYGVLGAAHGSDVARWNGQGWEELTDCLAGEPGVLTAAHDGTAERLFTGGSPTGSLINAAELKVLRPSGWEVFAGPDGPSVLVQDIAGLDTDGAGLAPRDLFAVRVVSESESEVIRFSNGSWTVIGGRFTAAGGPVVHLTVRDLGTGPVLYATGIFDTIDANAVHNIAVFDDATDTWQSLGGGRPGARLLARPTVITEGSSTSLFVGGSSAATNNGLVFRWDGSAWSDVIADGRLNGGVQSLAAFDDGSGPGWYVVGTFTLLDGASVSANIIRWNGAAFESVAGGLRTGSSVPHAVVFDDQGAIGSALWIANQNSITPESSNLAVLRRVSCCAADFNNSGSITVQDIFDFLAAYFAGLPSADFNGAGGITVQDIFDYLAAYFVGCP